eukprot:c32950_g1_i1 orf=62-220(+)
MEEMVMVEFSSIVGFFCNKLPRFVAVGCWITSFNLFNGCEGKGKGYCHIYYR